MKTKMTILALAILTTLGTAMAQTGQGQGRQQGPRDGSGRGRGQQGRGMQQGPRDGSGSGRDGVEQQKLKGRDVVRLGKVGTLIGTLAEAEETCEDGEKEYVLKSGDGVYNLHFGPSHYREENGITLVDGAPVSVTGFVYENDIAVNSLAIAGNTYTFRDENGRPAWAGQGERSESTRGGGGQGGGRGRRVAN